MARSRSRSLLIGLAALAAVCAGAGRALAQAAEAEASASGAPPIDAGDFRISGEVRYTAAGAPVTLFHYFALGADCAPAAVAITLADPPSHGAVSFVDGAEAPSAAGRPLYAPPDPRARCVDQLVATRDAVYAPEAGFVGHDRLTIEFREGSQVFDDTIEVNVEKIASPPASPPRKRGRRS